VNDEVLIVRIRAKAPFLNTRVANEGLPSILMVRVEGPWQEPTTLVRDAGVDGGLNKSSLLVVLKELLLLFFDILGIGLARPGNGRPRWWR
jgi:hypothetical protein